MLFGMETVECEVALASAAIPAPMVLDLASNPVATLQVNLHSGLAQVIFLQYTSVFNVLICNAFIQVRVVHCLAVLTVSE